jgi:hypothetical protein
MPHTRAPIAARGCPGPSRTIAVTPTATAGITVVATRLSLIGQRGKS